MPLEQVGWSLLARVISLRIAPFLVRQLDRLPLPGVLGRVFRIRRYLTELSRLLNRMPFIYEGMESEVLNDFVASELDRFDPETFDSVKRKDSLLACDPIGLLKDFRFAVIVGRPGIGKTTFQRHALLQLLGSESRFIYAGERLVPIYVPLKVIPNVGPTPIQSYIRQAAPFFGNRQELLAVTKDRGLFLCIDGYDEIAQTGTTDNYIRAELEQIFYSETSSSLYPDARNLSEKEIEDRELAKFYEYLGQKSRVWLTSRPQFIQFNPIRDKTKQSKQQVAARVTTLGVVGVGKNREALVQKLFGRYAERFNPNVLNILNPETFLRQIDRSSDSEMREMSFVPLFLTVMCYNYAERVLRQESLIGTGSAPDVQLSQTFEALISQCIDLLLNDLDDYKARHLPTLERRAMAGRRNEFVLEKREFLRYLAALSYTRSIPYFSEDQLSSFLAEFADESLDAAQWSNILKTFHGADSDRPSFIRQLIYCGLFVRITASNGPPQFDFPHRRFREVLAVEHFSRPNAYFEFLTQVGRLGSAAWVELITVLKRSTEFNSPKTQRRFFDVIVDKALAEDQKAADYIGETQAFFELLPVSVDLSAEQYGFVRRALQMRAPRFRVSASTLTSLATDADQREYFGRCFDDRVADRDAMGLTLVCNLISVVDSPLLKQLTLKALNEEGRSGMVLAILVKFLLRADAEAGRQIVARYKSDITEWPLLAVVLNLWLAGDVKVLQAYFSSHSDRDRLLLLLYFIQTHPGENREIWSQLCLVAGADLISPLHLITLKSSRSGHVFDSKCADAMAGLFSGPKVVEAGWTNLKGFELNPLTAKELQSVKDIWSQYQDHVSNMLGELRIKLSSKTDAVFDVCELEQLVRSTMKLSVVSDKEKFEVFLQVLLRRLAQLSSLAAPRWDVAATAWLDVPAAIELIPDNFV